MVKSARTLVARVVQTTSTLEISRLKAGFQLTGRRVVLRELRETDLAILHRWRCDPQFQRFCSTRRDDISLEAFRQEVAVDFARDRQLQFMILRNGLPVGTIFSYKFNPTDGHVFITIYVAPEYQHLGCGPEAFALFTHFLFQSCDLFKIYVEVYDYNEHSLKILQGAGFVVEGRFRGHRFFDGKRYDLIRLSLFADSREYLNAFVDRLHGRKMRPCQKGGERYVRDLS